MERPIGEKFDSYGVMLEVVEENGCKGCYFDGNEITCDIGIVRSIIGRCTRLGREDNMNVIFKKVE